MKSEGFAGKPIEHYPSSVPSAGNQCTKTNITDEQVDAAKLAFTKQCNFPDLPSWLMRAALEAADAAAWCDDMTKAPKDGTLIQVWRKNHIVATAYWNKNLSCWKNPNIEIPALFEPTHFRPLPEPPK